MPLTAFSPDQLHQFTREFEDLFDAADPASMTSYYSEDAKLMADGMQPIEGHAAIMGFWHAAITRAAAAGARRHPAARIALLGRPGIRPVHGDRPHPATKRHDRRRHQHRSLGRHHLAARP